MRAPTWMRGRRSSRRQSSSGSTLTTCGSSENPPSSTQSPFTRCLVSQRFQRAAASEATRSSVSSQDFCALLKATRTVWPRPGIFGGMGSVGGALCGTRKTCAREGTPAVNEHRQCELLGLRHSSGGAACRGFVWSFDCRCCVMREPGVGHVGGAAHTVASPDGRIVVGSPLADARPATPSASTARKCCASRDSESCAMTRISRRGSMSPPTTSSAWRSSRRSRTLRAADHQAAPQRLSRESPGARSADAVGRAHGHRVPGVERRLRVPLCVPGDRRESPPDQPRGHRRSTFRPARAAFCSPWRRRDPAGTNRIHRMKSSMSATFRWVSPRCWVARMYFPPCSAPATPGCW